MQSSKGKPKKGGSGGARVVKLRPSAWEPRLQPGRGSGKDDEEEACAQRAAEVACTSELLTSFHAHRDAWERMEVG